MYDHEAAMPKGKGVGKLKALLILLPALAIIGIIIYTTPTKIEKSLTFYSDDGAAAEVALNLAWHRYLHKPTELWGEMILNGKTYISMFDYTRGNATDFQSESMINEFFAKLRGERNTSFFVLPDAKSMEVTYDMVLFTLLEGYDVSGDMLLSTAEHNATVNGVTRNYYYYGDSDPTPQ